MHECSLNKWSRCFGAWIWFILCLFDAISFRQRLFFFYVFVYNSLVLFISAIPSISISVLTNWTVKREKWDEMWMTLKVVVCLTRIKIERREEEKEERQETIRLRDSKLSNSDADDANSCYRFLVVVVTLWTFSFIIRSILGVNET